MHSLIQVLGVAVPVGHPRNLSTTGLMRIAAAWMRISPEESRDDLTLQPQEPHVHNGYCSQH